MSTRKSTINGKYLDPDARDPHTCRRGHSMRRWLLICLLAGMVSACGITKDYHPPSVDMAPAWRVELDAAADLANTAWWESFQDPVLTELITIALNENKDLLTAAARVEEFEAQVQVAKSEYFPELGYGVSADRRQNSEEGIYQFGGPVERTNTILGGVLNASWELDVWGRIRRANEAARAELMASEEVRRGVIMSLVSSVADRYMELLTLDKQLEISHQTVDYREELLKLFDKKLKGGQITKLELIQVRQALERAQTAIPRLELLIALQENALSVLLGRNPGAIQRGGSLDTVAMPGIPAGIPSDILIRRPDIRRAEQDLIAANARIGVARTLYFPRISLTGFFGYASNDISNLLVPSANIWQVGGDLLGPIFEGGRIKATVRQAEAQYKQLLNAYLGTIQIAFQEVNDSLVSIQKQREELTEQERLLATVKDYADFSRKSYDAGFSSYLTVLDAEEKYFVAKLTQAQTKRDLLISMVGIYKAMGGGWIDEAEKQIAPAAPEEETQEASAGG